LRSFTDVDPAAANGPLPTLVFYAAKVRLEPNRSLLSTEPMAAIIFWLDGFGGSPFPPEISEAERKKNQTHIPKR